MNLEIKNILKAYLADIIQVTEIMKSAAAEKTTEEPWEKVLYPSGEIAKVNLKYHFHGSGCWVKWKGKFIDFDFIGNSDKNIWGIDTWFAACYLQSLQLDGFEDKDYCHKVILQELKRLENLGEVVKYNQVVYFFTLDFDELRIRRGIKNNIQKYDKRNCITEI